MDLTKWFLKSKKMKNISVQGKEVRGEGNFS